MGRDRQKPRHKAGLAGQGTSQGLQVEKAQPSWGDGTEGLNRGRSKVLWGPSKVLFQGNPWARLQTSPGGKALESERCLGRTGRPWFLLGGLVLPP